MPNTDAPAPDSERRRVEDELVRQHLQLVGHCVDQIRSRIPRHVPREDLMSAGMAGLAHAARGFDESRGIRFDRYAGSRVRGAILDELRSFDWASRSVRATARKVGQATEELTSTLGRAPSNDELAARTGIQPLELQALTTDVHRASVVRYESLLSEDVLAASDTAGPEAYVLDQEQYRCLLQAVSVLPERLRHVVVSYFFEDRPMQEIAEELGVTQSRVSQMRGEALDLMRHGINSVMDPGAPADERPVGARMAKRRAAYRAAVVSLAASKPEAGVAGGRAGALAG